jgi:hypothetical protein
MLIETRGVLVRNRQIAKMFASQYIDGASSKFSKYSVGQEIPTFSETDVSLQCLSNPNMDHDLKHFVAYVTYF